MAMREILDALIPLEFAATLIQHTISVILLMGSIYVVGWAATILLPHHPGVESALEYAEEGLFIFLVALLSIKLGIEAYKRWFPDGFPFKFIVA
jgi:hypothetical protein